MPTIIDGSLGITAPTYGGADTSEYLVPVTAFKNRIINGAMVIDQRNAGAVVTVNSTSQTFCTDRWWASGQATDGVFTMAQSTNAPTGFNYSLQNTITTADASIGATQRYYIAQRIEGFNTADLAWGTANAKTVTLSFWVRSSLTGTFGGFIYNSAADYSYPFSYSISVADTWEYKTITIAGPTAGTWIGSTNGVGMQIGWSLGAGADRLGTAGSWASAQYFGATGQTQVIGTLNATFYITGVQLEVGSTATSFDYRPYGTELALCQRYFQRWDSTANNSGVITIGMGNGTTVVDTSYPFKTSMRSTPTLTSSAANTFILSPGGITISSVSLVDSTSEFGCLRFGASVASAGAYKVLANSTTSAFLNFSSEL